MTINERLRNLRRDYFSMSMEEFGKILGISKSGVSEIESGRRNVTEQHIRLLTNTALKGCYVSEEWLRSGIGEPFEEGPKDDMIREFVERSLAEQPPGVRRWVLSMLTEFSDGWWDEIEDVLKRIQNREIGPHADQMQDDALPAHLRPVAAHAMEGATVEELLEDATMMAGSDDEEI